MIATALLLALLSGGAPPAVPGTGTVAFAPSGEPHDPDLRRLIEDYVGLYRANRLDDWAALLHDGLSVADPRPDGTVRMRDKAAFLATQRGFFASGRRIGERLESVRVGEGRRIARVDADFVFVDEGEERRGRLGLHLARTAGGWRIVAILFSYDRAR
ncbi:MAG TPA: nuclear transport factor 2 family protein [Candidatus Polarisedimenticolia bacterium]|nr:nuclear transport factor 2 family protein [Candidatus Polarisedimenticolia bacterium]